MRKTEQLAKSGRAHAQIARRTEARYQGVYKNRLGMNSTKQKFALSAALECSAARTCPECNSCMNMLQGLQRACLSTMDVQQALRALAS